MNHRFGPALSCLLGLAIVAGCSGPTTLIARTPLPFDAPLDAAAANDLIQVAFNNTYQETVALNEPLARATPTNTDRSLLRVIRGAKATLDGAFYDIEELGVVEALIKASKDRGVAVRLVTDTDNMVEKSDHTQVRQAIKRLRAAGISVVDDQRAAIMHHKFLVADSATVWTGSANLTPTSLYRHNNNAMTIRFPTVAVAFAQEFARLFERRDFAMRRSGAAALRTPIFHGAMAVHFSPFGGAHEAVLGELKKAQKSIRFMTFSLTSPELGRVMLEKAHDGVVVEGIFDRWLAGGAFSLFPIFRAQKLPVWLDGNEALMHHKAIIIDDKVVITGSYNFSQSAEAANNEALMIIRDVPGLTKAFNGEFKRLITAAQKNKPPATKPKDAELKTGEGP